MRSDLIRKKAKEKGDDGRGEREREDGAGLCERSRKEKQVIGMVGEISKSDATKSAHGSCAATLVDCNRGRRGLGQANTRIIKVAR